MSSLQQLVDALAEELGRPVGVDDRRFRALAYSSHSEEVDTVRRDSILRREAPAAVTRWLLSLGIEAAEEPVRIPSNPEFGMDPRLCLPLRFEGATLGYLWVIDRPALEDARPLGLLEGYAGRLAVELVRVRRLESAERERQTRALLGLLSGEDPGAAAELLTTGSLTGAGSFVAILAEVDGSGPEVEVHLSLAAEEVRRGITANHALVVARSGSVVLALGFEDPAEPEKRAGLLLDACRHHLASAPGLGETGVEVVVGVGAARRELTELPASYQEARHAAEVGRRVASVGIAAPVAWEELGAWRPIAALLADRDAAPLVPDVIDELLAERDGLALLETVEAYLDRGGDAKGTSDSLHLHRSSLYKRLHRIERLSGYDLRRGDDRLELHLALRLWRLAGRRTSPSPG